MQFRAISLAVEINLQESALNRCISGQSRQRPARGDRTSTGRCPAGGGVMDEAGSQCRELAGLQVGCLGRITG